MKIQLHKLAGALGLPLFLLVATVLFRWDEGQGAVAPPPPDVDYESGATDPEHLLLQRQTPATSASDECLCPDPAASAEPGHDAPVLQQAKTLLYALSLRVDSGLKVYPEEELAEITALINGAPETAEVFLDAIAGSSALVKAWLKVAFIRVDGDAVREDLMARHRENDPVPTRIDELLGDTGMVLATLRYPGEAEVRYGLINRLGNPLLDEPEVMETLLHLADQDTDPKVRAKALARIGRLDRPEIKELLLRTLRDTSRELSDRQTAARMLCCQPDEETTAEFIGILAGGADPAIMRFAAKGLRKAAAVNPAARSSLTDLLGDWNADLGARKNAASSLASSMHALDEGERDMLGMQLLGHLKDLVARGDDHRLLLHTFREVGHTSITDRMGDELRQLVLDTGTPEQIRKDLLEDRRFLRIMETHR